MSNDNFTFPAIHVNVTLEIGFIIALKRSILVERAVILETERSIKTLRYFGYIAAACGERNVKINGRYVHRISTKKHCVRHILINITHSQLMLSFVMPEKRYLRSDRKVDPSHKSCSAAGSQTKDAAFHSQWLRCKVLMTASAINHIMTQLSSTYWTHTHTHTIDIVWWCWLLRIERIYQINPYILHCHYLLHYLFKRRWTTHLKHLISLLSSVSVISVLSLFTDRNYLTK